MTISYLYVTDLSYVPGGIKLFISVSKTDPFGSGIHVHIATRDDILCPVKAIFALGHLLEGAAIANDQFVFTSSKSIGKNLPLSHGAFVKRIKFWITEISLDPKEFSGHSLCCGGATALLHAGVSPELIQVQGRWRSDAYKIYLQHSAEQLLAITRAIPAL
jgi:hypothetical protein